jgi:hypothetical protein
MVPLVAACQAFGQTGVVDLSFDPGTGPTGILGYVQQLCRITVSWWPVLLRASMAGIVVGGGFDTIDGVERQSVARLLDHNPGSAFTRGVRESDTNVLIQVTRVETHDGQAKAGQDYVALSTNIQFADCTRSGSAALLSSGSLTVVHPV